jgi:hypothetical protein
MDAYPDLVAQWHHKNTKPIFNYTHGSGKNAWWMCDKSTCDHPHEWQSVIKNRTNGNGCPYCSGQKYCKCNSFGGKYPELAEQWHTKNKKNIYDYAQKSNEPVWWLCKNSTCEHPHEWQAMIANRTNGNDCPYCSNHQYCKCNSFGCKYPELAKQWHPTKNKKTPYDYAQKSGDKIWWICCICNHEWQAMVNSRTNGCGCPRCAKKMYKSENACREIFEEELFYPFPNLRPAWLGGLELDGYCKDLNLAWEYNGKQHYEYVKFFHRGNPNNLILQQERDALKHKLCKAHVVNVITIPYKYDYTNAPALKSYIVDQLCEMFL